MFSFKCSSKNYNKVMKNDCDFMNSMVDLKIDELNSKDELADPCGYKFVVGQY